MKRFFNFHKAMLVAAALTASVTASAAPAWTIDPQDGAEVKSLSSIVITFPDANASDVTIADESLIEFYGDVQAGAYSVNLPLRRPEITITFEEPISTPGSFGIFVNSGAFLVNGAESGEIDVVYTILGEQVEPEPEPEPKPEPVDPMKVISINPAPGVVTSVGEWTILFDCDWALGDRTAKYTVECSNPDVVIPTIKSRSNNVYFDGDELLTAPGTYTFTIPAGKFLVGPEGVEVPNPEMQFEYIIEGQETPGDIYTGKIVSDPDPAGTYTEIEMFLIEFDSEVTIADASKITVVGPEGEMNIITDVNDNYLQVFPDNDAYMFVDPGQYTLTVDDGALTVGSKKVQKFSFQYTIGGGAANFPAYSINPVEGTYKSIDEGFTLMFDTEEEISINLGMISLTGPDGNLIDITAVAGGRIPSVTVAPVDAEDNPVALTESGRYSLIFGVNAITAGTASNDEPLVFIYDIEAAGPDEWNGEYTASPADEAEVESLKQIIISFTGATTVKLADQAGPNDFPRLTDMDGIATISTATAFAEGNTLEVTLSNEVTETGYYMLIVPSALLTVDGKTLSDDIYLTYGVKGKTPEVEYTYTTLPKPGTIISPEAPIKITFKGEGLVKVTHNTYAWGKTMPHFTSETEGAYIPSIQINKIDAFSFELSHANPFTQEGTYTLNIPADYFTLEFENEVTVKNKAFTIDFKVMSSGVENIEADGDIPAEYFNLQGVRVETPAKGNIYIIRKGEKSEIIKF